MADERPEWRPVQRLRTHEQVLAAIEDQIIRGTLSAGDRLPSERVLAEYLGVSRPSVREALRILDWMGVIVAGVGSGKDAGSIIATHPSPALDNLLRLHLALSHFSLEEVVETRITLESAAVEAAAQRATPEELAPLRALVEKMSDPSLEPHEFNELDTEFHVSVAGVSGNQLLMQLMKALRSAMRQLMVQAFERLPDWRSHTGELASQHTAIVDAMERGDVDAAKRAVSAHIRDFYMTMAEQAAADGR